MKLSAPYRCAHFALSPLAAVLGLSSMAMAADPETYPKVLNKLTASGAEESPKVEAVSSPKFTQPLVDTPQTIAVVPAQVLRQQAAGTLVEALANTPGITLQLGENGNTSAGDAFSMRGSASQTNVFLDGLRDMGAITRDTFNTEQVEIAKGAVGADFGRGTTSGYINQVSKLPRADNFGSASLGLSSAPRARATADLNYLMSDTSAVRVNAVWQGGDMVGRNVVTDNRWGLAPALAFGLDTQTKLYIYSQHVRARNVPDGGVSSLGLPGFYNATLAAANITPAAVNPRNYYGRYDDYEQQSADMVTVRLEHQFSDAITLNNSTRWGTSDIDRVLTGINALTVSASSAPSTWTVARTRQSVAQENKMLTNQTNLNLIFHTGGIEHDLATGVEWIREQQYSPSYIGLGTLPAANVYTPNASDSFTDAYTHSFSGAYSDGRSTTIAGYAFDTIKLSEQWQLTTGLRVDEYSTRLRSVVLATANNYPTLPLNTPVSLNLKDDGTLLSYKAAVTFKPTRASSVYLAFNRASQPPAGSNFVLSDPNAANTTTNINRPGLEPQRADNFEIGTKWDVINERLSLTAAIYRTDNHNEVSVTDSTTNEVASYGLRRVKGIELGVVGKITEQWQVIAGFAKSDNQVIEGSTGNNATGAAARFAPKYSANLWTTYSAGAWTGGIGGNYLSKQLRVVDPSLNPATQAGLAAIPGYTVLNGMLSYAVNSGMSVQLNINNLLDKSYIQSLNNGGSRVRMGAPINGQLTLSFSF